MVKNMKSGTLQFETSIQRGMPIQLPNIFEKIQKCVSVDPLFKLCFTVNPNKKYVKIRVRVPGFKKAIDNTLKSQDLTQFQQRMFGTKVGNALHDIAKRIHIPSVDDIFGEMDKNEKRKKDNMKAQGRSLSKMQKKLMKMLTPKQKSRFKKLTSTGLFKIKCGEGRSGLKCRQRKAQLLRKIARKIIGRKRREKRRKQKKK
eukprot:997728_1